MSACTDITHTLDIVCIKKDKKTTQIVKQTEPKVEHRQLSYIIFLLALEPILHKGSEDDLHMYNTPEGTGYST